MATDPDIVDAAYNAPERRLSPAQVGLVAVGLLVLLVLVWFLFVRSSDEPEDAAVAPAPVTEEAPEEEVAEPPTKRDPVETFEVFAPKDPFDPLVSASAGSPGGASAGTAAAPGATTITTAADGTTTTTVTTSGSGAGANGGGEEVGGHRVRVIDVFREGSGRRAQVQVDGTVYTVDEGETFAANFQLLSASARCATMLFGDDEFTLCEGEEILK